MKLLAWEEDWFLQNVLSNLGWVIVTRGVWAEADEKLPSKDAKGPPIDHVIVALLVNDLGSHIVWRTTQYRRLLIFIKFGSQSEINQLNVAILINHDVLSFQITIHQFVFMKVTQNKGQLERNNLRLRFCHSLLLRQMGVQFSTLDKWHEDVELLERLETVRKLDHEWMTQCVEDLLLIDGHIDHVLFD